MAVCV